MEHPIGELNMAYMHRQQARIGLLLPLGLLDRLAAEAKNSDRCMNEVVRTALVGYLTNQEYLTKKGT